MGTMATQMSFPRLVVSAGKSAACQKRIQREKEGGVRTEKFHKDIIVNDFYANVSVQSSSDQATNNGQNVTSSLVVVWVDTLNGGVVCVLALLRVLEETEEHIDEVDENIGAQHALPEIPRVAHLSEKVEEEHGSSVGVDDGVDTLVSAEETSSSRCVSIRGSTSKGPDGNVAFHCAVGEIEVTICCTCTAERTEHGSVVGVRVACHADSHQGSDDSGPHGEIGKPSETLKRSNLAEDHTQNGNDEKAYNEANTVAIDTILADRDLGYGATKTEDKHGDQHEH